MGNPRNYVGPYNGNIEAIFGNFVGVRDLRLILTAGGEFPMR